jgi:hypothetical protein
LRTAMVIREEQRLSKASLLLPLIYGFVKASSCRSRRRRCWFYLEADLSPGVTVKRAALDENLSAISVPAAHAKLPDARAGNFYLRCIVLTECGRSGIGFEHFLNSPGGSRQPEIVPIPFHSVFLLVIFPATARFFPCARRFIPAVLIR